MSAVSTMKMTARQFLQLGEDPPGVRLELVDGEIEVSPSPRPRHSYIVNRLTQIILNHLDASDSGELYADVDTIFGDHDVRRPDLIFFQKSRLHLVGERAMEGPPDLAVEIVSPTSVRTDRVAKFRLYESGGVSHYWIVDAEARTIEAYRLDDRRRYQPAGTGRDDDEVHLPPFSDLALPLGKLWPRRDRQT